MILKVVADAMVVSLAVGLLLIPVFILFLVPMSRALMAVTASICLIAFTVVISAVTGAKVQEVFFGTAA